eukprot:1161679-Pelagomonas_calceolata.AAC.1
MSAASRCTCAATTSFLQSTPPRTLSHCWGSLSMTQRHRLMKPLPGAKEGAGARLSSSCAEPQALYYDRLVGSDATLESSSPGQDQTGIHRVSSAPFALTASEDAIVQGSMSLCPPAFTSDAVAVDEGSLASAGSNAVAQEIGYLALTDAARLGQLMATLLSFLPEQ